MAGQRVFTNSFDPNIISIKVKQKIIIPGINNTARIFLNNIKLFRFKLSSTKTKKIISNIFIRAPIPIPVKLY